MTAPTTRAEFRKWLGELITAQITGDTGFPSFGIAYADRLLAALDTFATVCPREPTDEMVDAFVGRLAPRNCIQECLAASPFAPENADG